MHQRSFKPLDVRGIATSPAGKYDVRLPVLTADAIDALANMLPTLVRTAEEFFDCEDQVLTTEPCGYGWHDSTIDPGAIFDDGKINPVL